MKHQLYTSIGLLLLLNNLTNGVMQNASYATIVFRELLEGPLSDSEIFVYEEIITSKIDWSETYPLNKAVIRATASNNNSLIFPSEMFFGSNFTIIWIIENENSTLSRVIGDPPMRCSKQLVIMSLIDNHKALNTFQTKATFCFKFVVLIQCLEKSRSAFVYVNFPLNENRVKHLGKWSLEKFRSKESIFLKRFENFSGSLLKVASICDDFPLLYRVDGDQNCRGSNLDALRIIGSHLNFSFEYQKESSNFNWGSYENGTWTGLLADLFYNGRHIVINYFLLNLERYSAFDSTYSYRAEGFGFLAYLPKPLPQWKAVALPFSLETWISVGAAVIIVTVLLTFISWIAFDNERSGTLQPITTFFLVVGSLISQPGSPKAIGNSNWRRVWMSVWLLFCIVTVTAFNGNLIAFLTVPQYPLRIETLEQLAQSPLRVTMQDYGEFVPDALKESTDYTQQAIGNKLDLFPPTKHYDVGMELVVANQTHALIETYTYLMRLQKQYNVTDVTYLLKEQAYQNKKSLCQQPRFPVDSVYSGHLSWLLPKHTPYTEVISDTLQRLVETGILQKLFEDHFGDTGTKKDDIVSASSLSMEPLQGAFYFLLMGLTMAFISCLVEIVSARMQLRHAVRNFHHNH